METAENGLGATQGTSTFNAGDWDRAEAEERGRDRAAEKAVTEELFAAEKELAVAAPDQFAAEERGRFPRSQAAARDRPPKNRLSGVWF